MCRVRTFLTSGHGQRTVPARPIYYRTSDTAHLCDDRSRQNSWRPRTDDDTSCIRIRRSPSIEMPPRLGALTQATCPARSLPLSRDSSGTRPSSAWCGGKRILVTGGAETEQQGQTSQAAPNRDTRGRNRTPPHCFRKARGLPLVYAPIWSCISRAVLSNR